MDLARNRMGGWVGQAVGERTVPVVRVEAVIDRHVVFLRVVGSYRLLQHNWRPLPWHK